MDGIDAPWPCAIAVSGGGDSIALMHLLAEWASNKGLKPPVVLTVDHGLRPGSQTTALTVQRAAKAIGLKVQVLTWKGKKPASNVEAAAREARYRLMGGWCVKNDVPSLYVGHTLDDVAETFLMRIARGSGVDGLAAMPPVAPWPVQGFDGLLLVRPLLGFDRDTLRRFLTECRIAWSEDPMNSETRFARTQIREVLPALEQAGLTKTRIADAATHLARAREALDAATKELLGQASRTANGMVAVDVSVLAAAPREIGLRALAALLRQVSGAAYRPRFERLERLFDSLIGDEFPKGSTLHGCRIERAPRAKALFGPSTAIISAEGPRKSVRQGKPAARSLRN